MKAAVARTSEILDRLALGTAIALVVAMLALVLWQVILRYLFNAAPSWTEELARACLVWAGLLGLTCAYRRRADPRLMAPVAQGSRAGRVSARVARIVAVLLFVGPLLFHGFGFVQRHLHRVTETLGITSGYLVAIVPLAAVIVIVHALAEALEDPGVTRPGSG